MIAYVMSRFPKLSETFILREMNELERQGYQIALYPLIFHKEPVVHAEAEAWIPRMRYSSFISRDILMANVKKFIRHPGTYGRLWRRVLWENRTSGKFLSRAMALFPKAVHMARKMQDEGIVHIHAHFATHPALTAWLIHHLTGIPFSVTVHAHDIFIDREMLDTKLGDAAFVVAISDYNRNYLSEVVGNRIQDKTQVIHCGISLENYVPRSSPRKSGENFEIISIGSLQPYKGYPFLIQACVLLRDRGIPFRCRIIGHGEEQERLRKMIAESNLSAVVELPGPRSQENIAKLLPTAHCYVQSSIIMPSGRMEGIPVSLMEAMACHLPVVASDISGIPELVRHGETGWLVPPANASVLTDALTFVYEHPEQTWQTARNGRHFVQEAFELSSEVRQLAMLLEPSGSGHSGPS